ncbi:MAG TPA: protein kinase, partial [Acidimicrobiia bacterium]|nr:protein kinase [Acidimicrobiia bacterium]
LSYLVMELVEGSTLRDVLADRGALPVAESVRLAAEVADGLAVAHERGIVHRDVKPGNVLCARDGGAKITDFGIARGSDDGDLTQVGTIVGTARYLAPEQVEGGPVDPRTDVYALGLVLYEMLAGRPAFDSEDGNQISLAVARVHADPPPPSRFRAGIPRDLEAVVMRALARAPQERFPTAAEFRNALRALTLAGPDATAPAGIPIRPADRRFTMSVALVMLVSLVVAAGGLFFAATETGRSVLDRVRDGLPGGDTAQAVALVAVADFDPQGDGSENPDTAALAHDGNRDTAWRTDSYHAPATEFGNLKDGIGLRLDLGEEHAVRRLVVHTLQAGWSAQVYVGDGTASDLAGWGEPVADGSDLADRAEFDLDGAEGSSVLLWITRLPATGQLEVAEVDVRA